MKLYRPLLAILGVLLAAGAVATYERTQTAQIGADGVAMQVTESRSRLAARAADNVVPPALPPAPTTGALAAETYENVHVLGHLTTGQFTRLMTAITLWVAPEQGCAYCHNTNNLASDELYPKIVSRRMLQMTQHINENWQSHVEQTGVTCYTCHRGQPVPEYIWFEQPEDTRGLLGNRAYQNRPGGSVGLSSLPGNPFETYLLGEGGIRVQTAGAALPNGNRASTKQAEWTYGLMMHFSTSLGVNCTYCHNSRSWNDWSQSPQVRTNAWYGIRMVRQINREYMEPLHEVFPDYRLGPTGDVPKASCMTCHQGAYRPLLGVSMLDDYPTLRAAVAQPAPPPPTTEAEPGSEPPPPIEASDVPPAEPGEPVVPPAQQLEEEQQLEEQPLEE